MIEVKYKYKCSNCDLRLNTNKPKSNCPLCNNELILLDTITSDYYQPTPKTNTQSENIPKCPTCQSTDIKKIGAFDRATSVAFLGLASSKIGKQFQCNNCGYKW